MTKPTITAFKRTDKDPAVFQFAVYFTLGETGGMLVPGFRIRDSLTMPPVYRVGAYWNRTVHLSTTTAAEIVDAVSPMFEEATGTSLIREEAILSLHMKPKDIYHISPDLLTERQTAEAIRITKAIEKARGAKAAKGVEDRITNRAAWDSVNLATASSRKEAKDLKRAANRAAHAAVQAAKEIARRTPGVLAFLEGPTL